MRSQGGLKAFSGQNRRLASPLVSAIGVATLLFFYFFFGGTSVTSIQTRRRTENFFVVGVTALLLY